MAIGLFWIAPIVDRTANDISSAYDRIRMAKAGNADIHIDSKGCLNASDLNRIENDIFILASSLGLDCICKEWADYFPEQPDETDKSRILSNAQLISDTLYNEYEYQCSALPNDLISYYQLNALEQCLLDASNFVFKPLKASNSDIFVTTDGETAMTVADYDGSFTRLNGIFLVSDIVYNAIEHDSNTEYIVFGHNEVREYIGDIEISR